MICHPPTRPLLLRPPNLTFGAIAGLIYTVVISVSLATPPRFQFNNDAFTHQIQEQLRQNVLSLTSPQRGKPNAFVDLINARFETRKGLPLWIGCGWGSVESRYNFEPRLTKLPDDPILILAAGYLRCQRIDISVLDPRVPVAFYPSGHFGDYVYENVLITDRLELSDEMMLRQLFFLMVESAAAVDEDWSVWPGEAQTEMKVSDFRDETGFVPEMLIELVGETVVRMEMNFTRQQVLIQSGDLWETYTLDPGSAAALKEMVIAEQIKQRQASE